jgi:hypothetical protein
MPQLLTTRQIACLISGDPIYGGHVDEWQVRRLYELGDLPPPMKIANKRVLTHDDIPAVVEALRKRHYLPELVEAAAS